MSNSYDLRYQPFKGLFLVYQLKTTAFVRLPLWTLSALFPSWRPSRSWSLKKALLTKWLGHASYIAARTGPLHTLPDHHALAPNTAHAVWIPPAPESIISASLHQWAHIAGVSPIKVPGYWMTSLGQSSSNLTEDLAGEDEKVVYHLHGGGYVQLSAYPGDVTAAIPRGLLEALADKGVRRAFSVEYRLSKGKPFEPAHPFPTALLDALAGYYYLVRERGFKPKNIIIEGDSAGGNLTLALTRYLCEVMSADSIPDLLSPPGALILLSPWSDISGSHDTPQSSERTLHATDFLSYPSSRPGNGLTPEFSYQQGAFTGPHGVGAAYFNEYISPASKFLSAPSSVFRFNESDSASGTIWPPTFVTAGGGELLLDQIRTLKERMVRSGVDVEYLEVADAMHDGVAYEWFEPERTKTLAAIRAWADKLWP